MFSINNENIKLTKDVILTKTNSYDNIMDIDDINSNDRFDFVNSQF